jgi:DNA gyrase subunit B
VIEASGFREVEVKHDDEGGPSWIEFTSRRDGVERRIRLDNALVGSAEYRSLAQNPEGLSALSSRDFQLVNGEDSSSFSTLGEALETLYSSARRSLTIQRYKGLGEMNPGQLWETTMDPEKRRLLQVRIEDEFSTDDIFSVLMGDQVEPRREFIQANALSVVNLDV